MKVWGGGGVNGRPRFILKCVLFFLLAMCRFVHVALRTVVLVGRRIYVRADFLFHPMKNRKKLAGEKGERRLYLVFFVSLPSGSRALCFFFKPTRGGNNPREGGERKEWMLSFIFLSILCYFPF